MGRNGVSFRKIRPMSIPKLQKLLESAVRNPNAKGAALLTRYKDAIDTTKGKWPKVQPF